MVFKIGMMFTIKPYSIFSYHLTESIMGDEKEVNYRPLRYIEREGEFKSNVEFKKLYAAMILNSRGGGGSSSKFSRNLDPPSRYFVQR